MNLLLKNTIKKYTNLQLQPTVAVSGGIDSITLSVFISKYLIPNNLNVAHAVSPAVPFESTKRVKYFSKKYNWNLHILDAGEMNDVNYISNPINRCYFCKTNLYGIISETLSGNIFSGANTDDLKDFRPGLIAAKNSNVIHPFVEAKIDKNTVRKLAKKMGLEEIAELPSSPCLSSRIETGIKITSDLLKKIDSVEREIKNLIPDADVRCRWLSDGVRIEFNNPNPKKIKNKSQIINLTEKVFKISKKFINIASYKKGSAFIQDKESFING